jgi:lipopolysaccharide transport system ATP-binding protein
MSSTVIKVENLAKQYRLGQVSTGSMAHDINRLWYRIRGKEDPYLKVGDENDRTAKGGSEYVWALRDINFEVKQGEVLGIIGRNGAGKSTLLKILSRTTMPTIGSVKIKGRVASLLEVGTGFHPELSGRDNIFLNGAILGMTKTEISRKFDEIVDFSGVERYIDTPVKRYSSGMYVRLAFGVAAHLEPEILIVDEVLAVGDAEFQKKCLGKMKDVSEKDGRTVLFVSHNMLAIKSLCNQGLLLQNGKVKLLGNIDAVIESYSQINEFASFKEIGNTEGGLTVHSIEFIDNGLGGNFDINKELTYKIKLRSDIHSDVINVNIFFNTSEGSTIFATYSSAEPISKGEFIYECVIPANTLNDNIYSLDLMIVKNEKPIHFIKEVLTIQGNESKRDGSWLGKFPGLVRPTYFTWRKQKIS